MIFICKEFIRLSRSKSSNAELQGEMRKLWGEFKKLEGKPRENSEGKQSFGTGKFPFSFQGERMENFQTKKSLRMQASASKDSAKTSTKDIKRKTLRSHPLLCLKQKVIKELSNPFYGYKLLSFQTFLWIFGDWLFSWKRFYLKGPFISIDKRKKLDSKKSIKLHVVKGGSRNLLNNDT